MKTYSKYLVLLCLAINLYCCNTSIEKEDIPKFNPPISFEDAGKWADSVVALMTLDEKITMIGGDRIFFTQAIPRLNIPAVRMSDATQGVRLVGEVPGETTVLVKSTSFPCPLLLAATWNTELAGKYAQSVGEECKAGGIAVLLGPGMNMYRISQCGRNFEYFGEDPYLAGQMIGSYVYGVQSTGTVATLKHFAVNNTDYYRRKSNSIVDDRALHEIYLQAFKAGIDAGAMAVMTSYNQVNGEWCGQSRYMIHDVLRQELGFRWLVMSDWWSVYDCKKAIKSGLDLEMPARIGTADAKKLVESGAIKEEEIDRMVVSLLRTLYAMQSFQRKPDATLLDKFSVHEDVALQTAREGIILLRNKNKILPVEDLSRKILLTGNYYDTVAQGGGSAMVKGYNRVTLSDALKKVYGTNLSVVRNANDNEIKNAEIVIMNIAVFYSEGSDKSFNLPDTTESEIKRIAELNPNTIIIINAGSGINMSAWKDRVAGIIYAWYPGQNGATALTEIITGKTNPSGKLPVTIERKFEDSPGYGYIPEGETLYEGWNDEQEKVRKVFDIPYKESIFIGYRWYEKKALEPLFPFGFGLSYTEFEYSDLKTSKSVFRADDQIVVTFTLTNSGKRSGSEICQLYVGDNESTLPRPVKELKKFDKIFLEPGNSAKIKFTLDKKDFSYWDPEKKSWITEPGTFEIMIGSSSADLKIGSQVQLQD